MDRGATLAIVFQRAARGLGLQLADGGRRPRQHDCHPARIDLGMGPPPTPNRPDELDPRVNNSIIHGRIQRAIEAVLEQKGYRRADPATADFLAEYRVGVKDARQVVTQAVPTGPSYWGGWAWGYYGPPPLVTSQEITYTEGALVVDIQQRSTGKLALRAIGRDTDITQADLSDEGIRKTVTKMLSGLP
jgi:hypothetical protein